MTNLHKDSLASTCIICKTKPFNGANGGLLIRSRLICSTCEMRIIQTPMNNEYYTTFKEELKAIWELG